MTWENTDRVRVAQIRHATRNRCGAMSDHGDHAHVCDLPGDHSGFGDDISHAADCGGHNFTWLTAKQRQELRAAHAAAIRAEWEQQEAEARERADVSFAPALRAHDRVGGDSIAARQEDQ